MKYTFLFIAIVSEVIGTTFMKQSEGFTKLVPSMVTVAGYAIAFYFLSLTLKDIPTGVAYALWSGIGIVLITLVAWLMHGQKLDAAALCGIALIVAGVVVMNVFSKSGAH